MTISDPAPGSTTTRRIRPIPELAAERIREAHARIPAAFRDTPQYVHPGLSARLRVPVIVKVETLNPIRSFKGRGTWIAIDALVRDGSIGADRPVVCASAGNFGQGVAYAAAAVGVPAIVYASVNANPGKVGRMRALGATVLQAGDDFDSARAASEAHVRSNGGWLLVDGEDQRIAAGAGTIALEITTAVAAGTLPAPAIVSVPVGNGALINGVGSWLRGAAPDCRVVGVQAAGAPAMTLSWRAGRPVDTPSVETYADGIASRVAIPAAVAAMDGRVDEMRIVDDDALRVAQAELTGELGVTVEGAAAASWAALLAGPPPEGATIVIVTGSNV